MSHNVTSPPGILSDIAVIGAGTMGNGIAHVCAQHGRRVTLVDLSTELLQRGLETIAKNLGRQVAREVLTLYEADTTLERINNTTELAEVKEARLVVEAVSESTDLKRRLFADLDGLCCSETILASNTSSISITLLGAATKRPDKVIGMHFMNPVPVMKLVEVIRGHDTSDETHDAVVAPGAIERDGRPITVIARPRQGSWQSRN